MENPINEVNNFMDEVFGSSAWISDIISIILIGSIIYFIASIIFRHIERISGATRSIWDDAIIEAAKSPITALIWLITIKFCVEILIRRFHGKDVSFILPIVQILITICVAWFFTRLVNFISNKLGALARISNDEFRHTTIDALSKLSKLTIVVAAILIILQIIGFSISGILAAGGAGGLIIGFAAKDLFANFFGGLTIYLDRPFNVGDWIRCAEKNIEGDVESIGWRQTRIRSFNKNPIYVPNAIFTNAVVENPSRMTHRRIKEHVGIRYQDLSKMKLITDEVRAMLAAHETIDNQQHIVASFTTFNNSSVDFLILAFSKEIEWKKFLQIKQDILLKISEIIASHGAEIAFPTRTLYVESQLEK